LDSTTRERKRGGAGREMETEREERVRKVEPVPSRKIK
jgi:hypothetical protein